MMTEASKAARQTRIIGLAGLASTCEARDMATGSIRDVFSTRPKGLADGRRAEEETANLDKEEEEVGKVNDITMAETVNVTRSVTDIETKTAKGALPTNIGVIQHNWARTYKWTIAALETGIERRLDVVCLEEQPRERGDIGVGHSRYQIIK
jgi:hypothetical protein